MCMKNSELIQPTSTTVTHPKLIAFCLSNTVSKLKTETERLQYHFILEESCEGNDLSEQTGRIGELHDHFTYFLLQTYCFFTHIARVTAEHCATQYLSSTLENVE